MKIVIVDDSYEDRINALTYISQYYEDITFLTPEEIKERFYTDYDIYFLDIEMVPDGRELARKVCYLHPHAILIFMTHHDSYIFDTQILNPFYFIRKAYFEHDLSLAMEMLENELDDYITITYNKENIIIRTHTIKYIEIYRGKVTFHTTKKDIYCWGTLSHIQKQLPKNKFIRIHSSYIINKDFIDIINKNDVHIDDITLPISRKYTKEVQNFVKRGKV